MQKASEAENKYLELSHERKMLIRKGSARDSPEVALLVKQINILKPKMSPEAIELARYL